MNEDKGFYSIIEYAVDGPETQAALVDAFAEIQERWVRFYPGYVSARFHASIDGTRVFNLVSWASEVDYRHFEETSDLAGRLEAIQAALDGLPGEVESRVSANPRYRVVREIGPGPRAED
ncbi:antibiotic biosynthesis monooxygenase [Amycolatopsis regifaucium]|uniref:Antibiotic biosynthesis monooxygenase n=1 Tax=Amycolatopsis regifaucium TaxID=546365 RepID=A0A154MQJ3_9PSEU|nr:antibiotic biosynthesis monooxygenase [Amycolatopsis regifaucium]KZB86077.1 antibiotic biosynthesis monooxygenase [Amycolatopsis regifaucium]OKA04969.1 antibiotic biosynthesis monooxygenase [Amycolatopsis regifaucium]SFH76982.1 C-6 monooxygenase [Amycolatopsis regifaucium]